MMQVDLTLTKAEVYMLIDVLVNDVTMSEMGEVPDYTDVTLMEYYLTRAVMLRKLKEIHND